MLAMEGTGQYFLNEGNDTFNALLSNTFALTVVGGNDAADGNDFILTGVAADVVLGNGGAGTARSPWTQRSSRCRACHCRSSSGRRR